MQRVRINTGAIADWPSFHRECQRALGFPDFYGRSLDAWIDCMSSLREDDGMVGVHLGPDEMLLLEFPGLEALNSRAPGVVPALLECVSVVNQRYVGFGESPAIGLVPL